MHLIESLSAKTRSPAASVARWSISQTRSGAPVLTSWSSAWGKSGDSSR